MTPKLQIAVHFFVVLLATTVGTALSGAFAWYWSGTTWLLPVLATALAAHFIYCVAYVVMGESIIEDVVKSAIMVILGLLWLSISAEFAVIFWSIAIFALLVGHYFRCVARTARDKQRSEMSKSNSMI